jgi:hypothetical protein
MAEVAYCKLQKYRKQGPAFRVIDEQRRVDTLYISISCNINHIPREQLREGTTCHSMWAQQTPCHLMPVIKKGNRRRYWVHGSAGLTSGSGLTQDSSFSSRRAAAAVLLFLCIVNRCRLSSIPHVWQPAISSGRAMPTLCNILAASRTATGGLAPNSLAVARSSTTPHRPASPVGADISSSSETARVLPIVDSAGSVSKWIKTGTSPASCAVFHSALPRLMSYNISSLRQLRAKLLSCRDEVEFLRT